MNIQTLDINKISVSGAIINESTKEFLIKNLLLGYSLARKNRKKGSLTLASYACGLIGEDNKVYFGVNFNNTRSEISSICAERLAILNTYNAKVAEFIEGENFSYKIKYVLFASYRGDDIFFEDRVTPCADCLSWFNSDLHFNFDAKIVCLKKDTKVGIILDIQPLESFLPQRNLNIQNPKKPEFLKRSAKAQKSHLGDSEIMKLYKKTLLALEKNNLAQTSGQNSSAGIIANGEIFTGVKVDFSKRWFIEPLKAASYKAIEKYGQNTKIEAVCYTGFEYTTTETGKTVKDGIISLQTLGRLNTKFADENTLVVTGGKDCLEVRTIGEFLPSDYKFIHSYTIK